MNSPLPPGRNLPTVLPNTHPWPKKWQRLVAPLLVLEGMAPPERVAAFHRTYGQANPPPPQLLMLAYMLGEFTWFPTIITGAWFLPATPAAQAQVGIRFYLPDIFAN